MAGRAIASYSTCWPVNIEGFNLSEIMPLHERITALFLEKLNLEVPSADADLLKTGVLDSLHFVELLLHLEQEFGIKIALDELELDHFCSVTKIADFVASYK